MELIDWSRYSSILFGLIAIIGVECAPSTERNTKFSAYTIWDRKRNLSAAAEGTSNLPTRFIRRISMSPGRRCYMLGCDLIFATVGRREICPIRGNIFGRKMP